MQARAELEALHASATEVQVRTAEKLGSHDASSYKLGRLLITSVSLKDSGLRGGKGVLLDGQAEYVPDPEAAEEMKGLGLPVAFGSTKAPSKAGHHQHKKLDKSNLSATGAQGKGGAKGRSQTAAVTTPDAASTLPSDSCESMAASGQIRSDAANCKQPSHQPAEDIFQDPAVLQAAVRKQPQQSHAAQPSGALHAGPQVHAYQRHGHDAPHPSHHHQHHQPLHPQLPLHVQQQQHPYLHPHPHPHPQALPQQQPVVALQPASLVQAVHFLNAYGFNLPLVWHAMGIPMTPATCTPADIWAAAQVARAPPELVHRALALPHQAAAADPAQASGPGAAAVAQPGQARGAVSSTAGPISCAALEQRLTSLNLDERPAQQQQQQQQQGGLVAQPPSHQLGTANHSPMAAAGAWQVPMHIPPGTQGLVRMDSPWQQEYDPSTSCFYYFNVAAQVTQWEVPRDGYRPRMMSVPVAELGVPQHPGLVQQQQQHLQPQAHGQPPQQVQGQQHSPAQGPAQQHKQRSPAHHQHQPAPTNGRNGHGHGKGLGANGKHPAQPNPNHTWQQLELLQKATDSLDGYASPCPEGEEQERVEVDPATAAFVRSILPRNMAKYWLQRYSLFSKYDDGIKMDTEGWYSVTPEVLALHQASMCKRYGNGHVVADAMAGCGGNVIQMAMVFPQVLGVEITQRRCTMAQHNASLYGVAQRVNMLCADFFAVAPTMLADAIFVSPPWGGPTYQYCESFDVLSSMIGGQRSVKELLVVCLGVVKRTWGKRAAGRGAGTEAEQQLQAEEPRADGQDEGAGVVSLFLPRNTDLQQLETLVPQGSIWLVERNFVNGKLKGITAYCF